MQWFNFLFHFKSTASEDSSNNCYYINPTFICCAQCKCSIGYSSVKTKLLIINISLFQLYEKFIKCFMDKRYAVSTIGYYTNKMSENS